MDQTTERFGGDAPLPLSKDDVVAICGPMTGIPFYNFPAFIALEAWLRYKFSCKVLNPTRNEAGLDYEQYMALSLVAVEISTTILLLDGWEKSPGANRELARARDFGLKILTQDEVL